VVPFPWWYSPGDTAGAVMTTGKRAGNSATQFGGGLISVVSELKLTIGG